MLSWETARQHVLHDKSPLALLEEIVLNYTHLVHLVPFILTSLQYKTTTSFPKYFIAATIALGLYCSLHAPSVIKGTGSNIVCVPNALSHVASTWINYAALTSIREIRNNGL
jgi:hypothetical protein